MTLYFYIILTAGTGTLILQEFLLWLLGKVHFINHSCVKTIKEWPRVSILVPARDEETQLPQCLRSFELLDYPSDKLQYIIGDDHSSDSTPLIISQWAIEGNNRVYLSVTSSGNNNINGKANALSQMAERATGEFLLFTDADCEVNPYWVKEMVCAYQPGCGLVTGITAIRPSSLFSYMQSMDWWLTLGMIKTTADLAYAVTAMGNNMLVNQNAYLEVGGFENVPFSVTEDFSLAQSLIARGYRPLHQVSAQSLAWTKSEKNIGELLEQRKRWLSGAMALPWYWLLLLGLQAAFFPMIIGLLLIYPLLGIGIWLLKVFFQSLFIENFAGRAEVKVTRVHLFLFEFYYMILSWCTIVYYFWPTTINWKQRQYR